MHDTPSHGSDNLFQIWKESIQNGRCCRADKAKCAIFSSFITKSWLNDLEDIGQGRVITRDTPAHASDDMCQI